MGTLIRVRDRLRALKVDPCFACKGSRSKVVLWQKEEREMDSSAHREVLLENFRPHKSCCQIHVDLLEPP